MATMASPMLPCKFEKLYFRVRAAEAGTELALSGHSEAKVVTWKTALR